jgi:hypothetical protein
MESTKAVADFYAEAKVRSAERFNSSSSSEEWNAIPFGALFPDCLGQTQNDVAEEFDPLFQHLMVTGSELAHLLMIATQRPIFSPGGRPDIALEEHHDSSVVCGLGRSCILSQLTSRPVSETERAGEL